MQSGLAVMSDEVKGSDEREESGERGMVEEETRTRFTRVKYRDLEKHRIV